jgi:hypothetical protein
LVASERTFTFAPGTTAPVGSVTVPANVAVDCAKHALTLTTSNTTKPNSPFVNFREAFIPASCKNTRALSGSSSEKAAAKN